MIMSTHDGDTVFFCVFFFLKKNRLKFYNYKHRMQQVKYKL